MRRTPVLATTVAAVVGLQVAAPLVALLRPDKPHRLGWQMYSGTGGEEIVVTGADGSPIDIPWADIVVKAPRPELDWTRHLPEHVCSHVDQTTVTVTVGDASRTVSC